MRKKIWPILFSFCFILFFSSGFVLSYLVRNNTSWFEKELSSKLNTQILLDKTSVLWSFRGPFLRLNDFHFLKEDLLFRKVDIGIGLISSLFSRDLKISFFSLEGFNLEVNANQDTGVAKEFQMKNILDQIKGMTTSINISDVNISLKNKKHTVSFNNIKASIEPGSEKVVSQLDFDLNQKTSYNAYIELDHDGEFLSSPKFSFQSENFRLKGHFTVPIEDQLNKRGQIYFHFNETYFHKLIEQLQEVVPRVEVIKTVARIIKKGDLKQGYLNFIKREQSQNYILDGKLEVEKLDVAFSPKWPVIKEIKSTIDIKNDFAQAKVEQAYSEGIAITKGIVKGFHLFDESAYLEIQSLLKFNGPEASRYLQETPLWDNLSFVGGLLYLENMFEMQLDLEVPIFNAIKTKAKGTLLFTPESQISFYHSNYILNHLKGGINFNQEGILLSRIDGFFNQDEFIFEARENEFHFKSYALDLDYKNKTEESFVYIKKAILPEFKMEEGEELKPLSDPKFAKMSIKIDSLTYNRKFFQNISAVRTSIEKGFVWEKINAQGEDYDLQNCSLKWQVGTQRNVNFDCQFQVKNFGAALRKAEVTHAMEKGTGKVVLNSYWDGFVGDFAFNKLGGKMIVDLEDMEVKDKRSKTRTFLNYLTFNIFKSDTEKIEIERLNGDLLIADGDFQADSFLIALPAMDMKASGKLSLEDKVVDMDVTMNLNLQGLMKTYGLYSAVALANPAILAVAFIPGLRAFSRNTIGKLFEQEYKIVGPLDNPQVNVTKFANIPIPGFSK